MEYIRPKETPKHKRESFGKAVAKSILKQFEDPKTAEEFKNWQEARKNTQRSAKA